MTFLIASSERILIWCSCGNKTIIFSAITRDCKLAAPINFIRAPWPGNWTPFDSTSFP